MKGSMWFRQLRVILWKNLIIRKRHWFLLLCEALIPVALFLLVAYGRSKITGLRKQYVVDVTYNEKYQVSYETLGFNLAETQLLYSPSNSYTDDIIHRVQEKFQVINNNIRGFDSQESLLDAYARTSNSTVIAIIFNLRNKTSFDYVIRYHKQYFNWETNGLYENELIFNPGTGSKYLWEGFLSLQIALDMSFIEKEKEARNETVPTIVWEALEFPYPPHKADSGLSSIFIHYFPLITLFSFIFVCPAVLKRVVEEKYTGIKELMKMVGMKSGILWFGWFIYSVLPMFLSCCLITIILKVNIFDAGYPPIECSDAGLILVFLLLYCMASIVVCFFLGSMFSKPTLATLVGLLLWILSYFVPKYIIEDSGSNESRVPLSTNIFLMLLPNMALHYGFSAMARYEEREIGVQWANWHRPGGGGSNEVTMLQVCSMLIFDCFLYMLFTLYIDEVKPGKYGVPKSYFFPLKSMFSKLRRNDVGHMDWSESFRLRNLEKGHYAKGIELIRLTKKYGKRKVVDNLSMDIDQNRITVLLGHNGAGKSTTMGMITGMIKKTSGHIIMSGKEITSRSDVMDSIGLCPQHNLFFQDLTVGEHLKFFAMLKGQSCVEAERELNELLVPLNLTEKKNESACSLSGGMKRKLCLGMAVIGGSKILILDEPSSGMDIQSRRHMWDLLLKWRNERTILITTHFMEEADALADYIFIMDEGRLSSHGTPFDLKKKYETGYNLGLIINKNEDPKRVAEHLHSEISTYVDNVKCKSVDGHEVVFLIPCSDENVNGNCQKMFEHLECNKDLFSIENISLSNTTLEDVFLKSKSSEKQPFESDHTDEGRDLKPPDHTDCTHYGLTLKALLFKRYTFIYRKCLSYLIPSAIALGFLLLCIVLGQTSHISSSSGGPAFKMALSSYGKTKVIWKSDMMTEHENMWKLEQIYSRLVSVEKSTLAHEPNVSTAIVLEGMKNLPYYRHHVIAAAEISMNDSSIKPSIEVVVMYNNIAKHSAPISLNLVTNTIAKYLLGEQYSIRYTNHPLDNIDTRTDDQLSEVQISLLWLIILPLGFLFFLGSFIYFPFVELSTNFTQLQLMCGVWPSVYWLTTFVSDLLVYIVFALAMTVVTMAWTPFRGPNEFGALYLLLVLYGVSGIPFSYLFGRKKTFTGAYALFIILGIMLGVLLSIIVLALEESGDNHYMKLGNIFRTIFLILCPQFGLTYSGVTFSRKVINNYNFLHMPKLKLLSVCAREEANACCSGAGPACDQYRSYLSVLSPHIFLMVLGAVFYLLVNILIHNYSIRKCFNDGLHFLYSIRRRGGYKRSFSPNNKELRTKKIYENFSSDVNDKTLRVKKLRKSYSGREVVNNVDFDLKKGECLGILGVNGAGKTTTFRMLTREEIKDNGEVQINNIHIDQDGYLQKLGYCPQNDALNFSLTGRDILSTMAMLRGMDDKDVVDKFLSLFELEEIADIPCGFYSGGNKRKLSFAVAVIGFPPFILLDEPTTGVDPSSRRKLWSLIKEIKDQKNNSFILTSHSMTECEALCNDLKIMKEGTIKKQGTIAKLKKEISGYSTKFKLHIPTNPDHNRQVELYDSEGNDEVDGESAHYFKERCSGTEIDTVEELINYLMRKYDGEVKDQHSGLLHFYIKNTEIKWSELFQDFEQLKLSSNGFIEDYMVSEASLEDVFMDVAKSDNDGEV